MAPGILPSARTPGKELESTSLTPTNILKRLQTPKPIRRRRLLVYIIIASLILLLLGRRHMVELQQAASSISAFVPQKISEAKAMSGSGRVTGMRWDDGIEPSEAERPKQKRLNFHLLIVTSAKTSGTNLCKTLLSAAILNYPPPTLVNYGKEETRPRTRTDSVNGIYNFLVGREARSSDLIMIVEEDTWFQIPAEATINRFFHGLQYSNSRLLEGYGRIKEDHVTNQMPSGLPVFNQRVLFGARKECSNSAGDPACYAAPESTLPLDIYGPNTDKHGAGKYNRPQFMGSTTAMGRVSDLRPIYKHASEIMGNLTYDSQHVLAQIFGKQEYYRSTYGKSHPLPGWKGWMASILWPSFHSSAENESMLGKENYDFGIGLDYCSWIFQVMNNSAEDVRFVSFDPKSRIESTSRKSTASFKNLMNLPRDLSLASSPFAQHQVSSLEPAPPFSALDSLPEENVTWSNIGLATNVVVPGGSVPATLNFLGEEDLLHDMWEEIWFQKYGRALLRQYTRSPDGPVAAKAAAQGGTRWWDMRGGKGGVWTDEGKWLEWNEVCGKYDEDVFRDGKGMFGLEDEEFGGQRPVYNGFGQVIAGKERPHNEENQGGENPEETK